MNFLTVFLVFFANFILQSTVLRYFEVFGVIPNTTLIFVIVFSFLIRERYVIYYGVVFGLLQDIFFGQIVGVAAFIYFTIGMAIFEIKRHLYRDTILSSIFLTIIGVTYYHLFYFLFMRLFDTNIGFLYILKNVYLIEIFYDITVSIILYKVLFRKVHSYDYR